MVKRSITDKEIALIKAMINRDMKNKDIQFFFNRPDRSVNSGRISQIRSGTYSNCDEISPATDEQLDSFLSGFLPTEVSATVNIPAAAVARGEEGTEGLDRLANMFERSQDGVWHFKYTESDQHECKENFGFKYAHKWLRAVAALANNIGGYILFGVKDKTIVDDQPTTDSYQVIGLTNNEFENTDPAGFSTKIKACFDPTPRVERTLLELDGLKIGVLYVHQHGSRPVIATTNEGGGAKAIKEGDIFFRYPGQSARIKYSDLRAILDDRDQQAREQVLPMVEKLLNLGPKNAMVADLASGVLSDDKRSINISEDLLSRIKFIRSGDFDEIQGAPALRLVGDVTTTKAEKGAIQRAYVTTADLLSDFLLLNTPSDPKEYIRCAIEGGNGAWLPMHYYAKKSTLNIKQLVSFIDKTAGTSKRKKMYRDRATGATSAYRDATGASLEYVQLIMKGQLPSVNDVTDAANFGRAIAGLDSKPTTQLKDMLRLLQVCSAIIQSSDKASWMSAIRRGAARLDELYYMTSEQ